MLLAAAADQFTVFGAKGPWAVVVMLALGSVTLVTVFRAGLVPLFRAIARAVEAAEVILGDGTPERQGIAVRLDAADRDREKQNESIQAITETLKRASLLNGKGEALVRDLAELKGVCASLADGQGRLQAALNQHMVDESTRNAAIWSVMLEDKQHPVPAIESPQPRTT